MKEINERKKKKESKKKRDDLKWLNDEKVSNFKQ